MLNYTNGSDIDDDENDHMPSRNSIYHTNKDNNLKHYNTATGNNNQQRDQYTSPNKYSETLALDEKFDNLVAKMKWRQDHSQVDKYNTINFTKKNHRKFEELQLPNATSSKTNLEMTKKLAKALYSKKISITDKDIFDKVTVVKQKHNYELEEKLYNFKLPPSTSNKQMATP